MSTFLFSLLLFSLFCPISSLSTTSCVATPSCSPRDLATLYSLAAAFPPPLFTQWHAQAAAHNNCCGNWGPLTINCSFCFTPNSNESSAIATGGVGRVTGLQIGLQIGLELWFQSGEPIPSIGIPISLCNLSALTSLQIGYNLISGPIPDCIGYNLTRLVHLDLSVNRLTGYIPLSFSLLPSLQILTLSYNKLSGIYPAFISSVRHLDLSDNAFSGPIPNTLSNLTHLTSLDLGWNAFSGPIPNTLSNLTHLTYLDLSHNAFSSPLPILNTPKLLVLFLESSYISGNVSSLFRASNLTSLEELSLSGNQLSGVIPNFNPFHFSSLSSLDLSSNQLIGSIPESLCGLINLEVLVLSHNAFSGQINMCNFKKLLSLQISQNQFTGPFPDWVGSLSNLSELSIGNNNLSGSLPNSWQNLTSLKILDLSGISITPSKKAGAPKLPCWLFAPNMEELHLSSMQLQATDLAICSSHCAFSLRPPFLDLSNNLFTSSILRCFSKIPSKKLSYVDPVDPIVPLLNLSRNPLKLDLSDPNAVKLIPESLTSLDLSSCMLRGHLTKLFFHHLAAPSYSNLYLADNQLEGQIPAELGDMPYLITLDLSNNLFTGFASLTNGGLKYYELKLSNNKLGGTLSSLLSRIVPNLSSSDPGNRSYCAGYHANLDLSHNFLTGVIPPFLGQCLQASFPFPFYNFYFRTWRLKLNHNGLEGSIPNVPFLASLQVLSLSNNQLSGQIPSSFRNLTQLTLLDLRHNKLEGNLQSMALFSNASSNQYAHLRVLLLGNNHFTGTIPASLGDIAPALHLIDFSNNSLTGSIPMHTLQSLQAFKINYFLSPREYWNLVAELESISISVQNLNLDDVGGILYEEININMKGNEEQYTYVLKDLTALDFSSNKLSGPIPIGMGELSRLVYLNLSRNNLSGRIPWDLGSLGGQLQCLDMSFNELVGTIPSSFQDLTSLEVFNVSYNKGLSGPIPLNNPQLYNKDSYIGDPKLCGYPILPNACPPLVPDGNTPSQFDDEPPKSRNFLASWIDEWIAIPGLLLGIFVGFLGTLWALQAFGR